MSKRPRRPKIEFVRVDPTDDSVTEAIMWGMDEDVWAECSKCHHTMDIDDASCPHCGRTIVNGRFK